MRRVGACALPLEARAAALSGALESRPRLRRTLLLASLAALAFVYLLPVFRNLGALGIEDWDYFFGYQAVACRTVLEYGQFPLWSPYHSGGLPLLANPQTRVLSPALLLGLATNAIVGVKLDIYVHYVVGLAGSYACARAFSLNRFASLMTACVYMLSGMLAMSVGPGMASFLSTAWVPWSIFFLKRAAEDHRYAVAAGVSLALMLFDGGVHLLALTAVSVVLYAAAEVAFGSARLRRTAADLTIASVVAATVSAIKLLPAIELMRQRPRVRNVYSGYSVESLVHSLVAPMQHIAAPALPEVEGPLRGMSWGWDENGMYVGTAAVLLMLVGLLARFRRELPLVVTLGLLIWLSFGERAPLSLWSVLHRLPVFEAMRVAQRFRFVWMVYFALLVGIGFQAAHDWILSKVRSKSFAAACGLTVCATVLVSLMSTASAYETGLSIPPPPVAPAGEFRQIVNLRWYGRTGWAVGSEPTALDASSAQYPAVVQNLGSIRAYEPLAEGLASRVVSSTWPGYRGEVFVASGHGAVQLVKWSPNRLVVDAIAEENETILFNQNFFPGWRSSVGRVVEAKGLLAVPVVPGRHRIEIFYRPASFVVGATVSLFSLAGIALFLVVRWRRSARGRGAAPV